MKTVAIVTPIYKSKLAPSEQIAINHLRKYCQNYDRFLLYPKGMGFEFDVSDFQLMPIEKHHFDSIESYNKLCTNTLLYELFSEYEYMLISQLDAYIFKDELDYWCKQGYSYIGAPWVRLTDISRLVKSLRKRCKLQFLQRLELKFEFRGTGNGGLCLRHNQTMLEVLRSNNLGLLSLFKFYFSRVQHTQKKKIPLLKLLYIYFNCKRKHLLLAEEILKNFNGAEDEFWSIYGPMLSKNFKLCPAKLANLFAIELDNLAGKLALNNNIKPFGGHACLRDEVQAEWRSHFNFIESTN